MEPIVQGIWRIALAGGTVNVYLLFEEDGLTLVDCGYPGSGEAILSNLSLIGSVAGDVRRIVVSHADIDHAGSLADLQRRTGAAVLAHALEEDAIAGRRQRSWGTTVEGRLFAAAYRLLLQAGKASPKPVVVDRKLGDGDSCGGSWQVVHTPGHTPGHIALFQARTRVLFTGDALGRRGSVLTGPKPMYATDIAQAAMSVRKLAALEPETLLFGHRSTLIRVPRGALAHLADRLAERHPAQP